jgi:outer membrane lipoprotein carrier protein
MNYWLPRKNNLMMKFGITIVFIFLFTLESFTQYPGFTRVVSTQEIQEQMKTIGEKQKTIQSTFSQVKKMEYLDIAIQSNGKFWYTTPSKVRWEYISPYAYTIIINNGKLSLISEQSENSFDMDNSDVFEQINNLMIGSVTGDIFDNADYTVAVYENKTQFLILLNPKSELIKGVVQSIELLFEKDKGVVSSIKMYETKDNYSEISFSNIIMNEPIPEKIFLP